ncbi:RNA-guided endonuclease InsQ/TnpB family protein [Citricoccus zhacaiensis]
MAYKRYKYRAYPSVGQQQDLARLFGSVRVVFNDVIAARREQRETGSPYENAGVLSKRLITEAKKTPERAWLSEVSAVPLQQSIRDADKGYRNFFDSLSGKRKGKKVGTPRFKSRSNRQSARFQSNAFRVRQTTHGVGFVKLARIGEIRFELHRELPSIPTSATIIKDTDGRYYVSFVVDLPAKLIVPEIDNRPVAGIDYGLTDLAAVVSSDGTRRKVSNPRWLRTKERQLARAQRALSRKKKGSKNREKARHRVAVIHRKVRDTRADHHHKLALQLVRENQTVVLEGVSPSSLGRTRMAKSIHDAAWGLLGRLIKEKAPDYGCQILVADRWAPTSQVCSVCGIQDGKKHLGIREWECPECGSLLDRDYNAAVNVMLAAGLADTLNVCGGNVRLRLAAADPSEARTHRIDPDGLAA